MSGANTRQCEKQGIGSQLTKIQSPRSHCGSFKFFSFSKKRGRFAVLRAIISPHADRGPCRSCKTAPFRFSCPEDMKRLLCWVLIIAALPVGRLAAYEYAEVNLDYVTAKAQ